MIGNKKEVMGEEGRRRIGEEKKGDGLDLRERKRVKNGKEERRKNGLRGEENERKRVKQKKEEEGRNWQRKC